MNRRCCWSFLALAVLVAGCRTVPHARRADGPTLVHRVPTDAEFEDRVTELTRAGHSSDYARSKARREFAQGAWRYEHATAWAEEKARAERSAAREKMEKELAQLDGL